MKATHLRVCWLTASGTSDTVTGRLEALHPNRAFVRVVTGFPVGTHGRYELILEGAVIATGTCTILGKKPGVGILVQLTPSAPSVRTTRQSRSAAADETGRHSSIPPASAVAERRSSIPPQRVPGGAPPSSPPSKPPPDIAWGQRHDPAPSLGDQTAPSEAYSVPPSPLPPRMDADLDALERTLRAHEEELLSTSELGARVGIDLGTSNLCVAAAFAGKLEVVPSRVGTATTPSVLSVIDGRLVVGHAAEKRLISHAEDTIYGSKRLLGRGYRKLLADEYQHLFAYDLVETADGRFGADVSGRVVSFEQVAERLLLEAIALVQMHLNLPIASAVITIPAYFGSSQREALRAAADRVGLEMARIVNEPTAAAVYYASEAASTSKLFVVVDLGGGTFDVTVLRAAAGHFAVIATGGDAFLGGLDVDDLLAAEILRRFESQHSVTLTSQHVARVRRAAEAAKLELTLDEETHVELLHFSNVDGKPVSLKCTLSRDDLETLTQDFISELVNITRRTLALAGIEASDIDELLLAGGAARMPIVAKAVEGLFNKRPKLRDPEAAVALGAATLAEGNTVTLRDILPRSIGLFENASFQRLIPARCPLPTEHEFFIRMTGAERTLTFFEGDDGNASSEEYLGTLTLTRSGAHTDQGSIEVLLKIRINGSRELTFEATVDGVACNTRWTMSPPNQAVKEAIQSTSGSPQPSKRPGGLRRFFAQIRGALVSGD